MDWKFDRGYSVHHFSNAINIYRGTTEATICKGGWIFSR
jgi:hypothetical protein